MKLECGVDKIKNALSIVEKLTGKNLTLLVLGSVLWIASKNKLKLRATNLSVGIDLDIPAKVDKEGVVATRGDVLLSFLSSLKSDLMVSFELINGNLFVKTKTNTVLLKCIPHDDFPTLPKIEGEKFVLPANKLVDGLKSVYYSASISEIKPEIGSVFIYQDGDVVFFVSTDSFRLAEKKIKLKQNINFPEILIPFKNVVEIIKVFENSKEDLEIIIQSNQISIKSENIYLTSRLVDGSFPDYKQIIPKNATTNIVVLKQDLLSSIKASNVFSDKFNQITFIIRPEDKIFEIESKNVDIGENTTSLTAVLTGENVLANFNYRYIIDCFQSINSDSLSIDLNGSNRPMVIKPVGDNSFMYIVMPMNK
jgi:DNA polymerase-3 subunit beta